jgi:hypothetical protein
MANTFDEKSEYELEAQQAPVAEPIPQLANEPPVKPNGSAGSTETQTSIVGGGIFDPTRWKTRCDARLDPSAKIQPATFSKIEVKKPPKDHYVHAHPDPKFNWIFPLYSDSEAKRYEPHLIAPELSLPPEVQVNIVETRLVVTMTDTERIFLWWVPQTGSEWHESADNCILTAMMQWVKVIPTSSGYRLEYQRVKNPAPVFPDWSFAEYLSRAFKDRYIESLDHAVIKRLRGIR